MTNLPPAYVVSCDLSTETGEGFLAHSLIEQLQSRFAVAIYSDWVVRILRSRLLLRDRVLPLYLFAVCLALRLRRRKVVLLNYVPIWNFLNAVLARCGVRLAPMTGSALVVPARASLGQRFKRLYLQKVLIVLSECLLPRRAFLWCATPSVYTELQRAGLVNLCFGFPYLGKIQRIAPVAKAFDLFIYSSAHPIKNHAAVECFLASPEARRFQICYVGPMTQRYENVSSFNAVAEGEFNQLLARSRVYVTFSFEDAGITGFKALAYGIPVLCPRSSGLAFSIQYEEPYCYSDPYDTQEICTRISSLLKTGSVRMNDLIAKFHSLKEDSRNASLRWLSSL